MSQDYEVRLRQSSCHSHMKSSPKEQAIARICVSLRQQSFRSSSPHRSTLILPLLAKLLLLSCLFATVIGDKGTEPTNSLETLHDAVIYLRADDNRLFRPFPSHETSKRQRTDACDSFLTRAYDTLTDHKSETDANDQNGVDAVNLISLCTTNNPTNRQKLTTVHGVAEAVVDMLRQGSTYEYMAAAAECIWISSFDSVDNHNAFVKAGAVDLLSKILTMTPSCTELDTCHHAQMWAAAALQNLAATYCHTESGYCTWRWSDGSGGDDDEEEEEPMFEQKDGRMTHSIVNDEDEKLDPKRVRLALLRNSPLVHELTNIICRNVPHLRKKLTERVWPTRAVIHQDESSPSLVPWAAIGLVKNLALSPGFYVRMPEDLIPCLCDHAVQSPDWLEFQKAEEALYLLGLEQATVCPPLYDADHCRDEQDWIDEDGNTCSTYENEHWCVEHGHVIGEDEDGDSTISANEACCACGGGEVGDWSTDPKDEL